MDQNLKWWEQYGVDWEREVEGSIAQEDLLVADIEMRDRLPHTHRCRSRRHPAQSICLFVRYRDANEAVRKRSFNRKIFEESTPLQATELMIFELV